jgi:hypothetical protein
MWKLKRGKHGTGWVVTFRGHPLPMAPRPKPEATAYMARVSERWPGDSALYLCGQHPNQLDAPSYRQGGPWVFTYPDGEVVTVHTQTKKDAMAVERHRLKRKALPRGTVVLSQREVS